MLYDQGISLSRSGYPTCLYLEKIDSRPPGAQKRAKKALLGPLTEKSQLPPFFGVRWIRPNGILGPPYPEVTLDNFSFPVGGLSAAGRAVFRPRGRILARKSVFCYRTPDFVNGFFVALDDIFDLAPSDRFLNFLFPSYGVSPSGLRLENLHFFTLHPYNPHFWSQTDPTQ